MQVEIIILAVIIFFVMTYNGQLSLKQLINDNFSTFTKLKEDDWDFYCRAKYGDNVNPDNIFIKRIRNGLIVIVVCLFFFIKDLSALKIVISFLAGYLIFKTDYSNIKKYYKKHIYYIDSELPHYLKSIEIYTHFGYQSSENSYIMGNSKIQIEYSLFWIGFSAIVLLLSIFPQIADYLTGIL